MEYEELFQFECLKCGHLFEESFPPPCEKCGHVYVKWVDYDEERDYAD